ncbi:hypothetical protein [Bacteriovorax sp. DB6_IX]|uniref:hypothetical protein n=1 Tax=Bacteriovorax sp. DB6_IX TaxID=1353530 RepID=UPI000389F357|nr:hypothetical protein [Bacteriovorax sp. DB6_IX]EQC51392.1 hypothetical protein M901_2442 [Bacteriovorax sp. DB6_IX]
MKFSDFEDCHSCDKKEFCSRSSGLVYLNSGKYTGSDKHTCDVAGIVKDMYLSEKS